MKRILAVDVRNNNVKVTSAAVVPFVDNQSTTVNPTFQTKMSRANRLLNLLLSCIALLMGFFLLLPLGLSGVSAQTNEKQKRNSGWYGSIPKVPGDEKFSRIFVHEATLYHESGEEVALWGVNFQSAMSWEKHRFLKTNLFKPFDLNKWKRMVDDSFDEIQKMGCDVIRIHLCPGDFADAAGNLVETDWLEMLDYTLVECHRRGIYINLALLNHLKSNEKIVPATFLGEDDKKHKWELLAVPHLQKVSENFFRQLVNRPNPLDNNRPYKHNPAWIIAEYMNEPFFPKTSEDAQKSPDGYAAYQTWLSVKGLSDSQENWENFKYEIILSSITRFNELLLEEQVPAVPCWNLFWSMGPKHEGWSSYDAAGDSDIPLVSFSTYPGQSDSQNSKSKYLGETNYLPYLKKSYEDPMWQGWLMQDRFKKHKARIAYEFEAWHNQTGYIYPAMAKYFRTVGTQVATMWTYNLSGCGTTYGKNASHNLSLVTTPRKAAGFLVAKEVFKRTPRYTPIKTTTEEEDLFGKAAYSFSKNLSVYADENLFVHSGDIDAEFINIPAPPKEIIGYGSSPFVRYGGHGIYFLKAHFDEGEYAYAWSLEILPHAQFAEDTNYKDIKAKLPVVMDYSTHYMFELRYPGMGNDYRIYRVDRRSCEVVSQRGNSLQFVAKPGHYIIINEEAAPNGLLQKLQDANIPSLFKDNIN